MNNLHRFIRVMFLSLLASLTSFGYSQPDSSFKFQALQDVQSLKVAGVAGRNGDTTETITGFDYAYASKGFSKGLVIKNDSANYKLWSISNKKDIKEKLKLKAGDWQSLLNSVSEYPLSDYEKPAFKLYSEPTKDAIIILTNKSKHYCCLIDYQNSNPKIAKLMTVIQEIEKRFQ